MTDQGGSVPEIAIQKLNQEHFRRTTGDFSTFRHSFHDTDELADIFRVEATQFSHGTGSGLITGVATDTVSLGHIYLPQETVVRTEIDRDRVCFTLPLAQGEQWKVNGVSGTRSPLFFNTNVDETYIYTKRRNSIFGHVKKSRFLDVLAALLGKDRDDVSLPSGAVDLSPSHKKQLISRMAEWIAVVGCESVSLELTENAERLETDIAHLLASAIFSDGYKATSYALAYRTCVHLVRNAEAQIEARGSKTRGLADLCSAANVSAPTLIAAFRRVTGTTPMRFFMLKRLARVRCELLSGRAPVSAVKQAGLRHGFVQLGRMSALYQSVYGEKPSETAAGL